MQKQDLNDIVFGYGTTQILKSVGLYEQKESVKMAVLKNQEDYEYHRKRLQVIKDAYDQLEVLEIRYRKVIREPMRKNKIIEA
jgi:hypothetical protein